MTIEKVLKNILIATVFANILLLVALVGLIVYNQRHRETETQKAQTSQLNIGLDNAGVCFTCDYLGPNMTAQDTLYSSIHNVNNQKLCCMNKPDFLPALARKITRTEEQRKSDSKTSNNIYKDLQWWRNRPNSIHMNLDFKKLSGNKLSWTDTDPLGVAFSNGVTFNKSTNSIIIPGPQRAKYFIYVAIAYEFGDMDTVPVFYHNVTKSHPLLPRTVETLLMSKYGGSSESDRMYTSFLCGSFEIQGGFNIKTEVSSYEHVTNGEYSSYFGMFRL